MRSNPVSVNSLGIDNDDRELKEAYAPALIYKQVYSSDNVKETIKRSLLWTLHYVSSSLKENAGRQSDIDDISSMTNLVKKYLPIDWNNFEQICNRLI